MRGRIRRRHVITPISSADCVIFVASLNTTPKVPSESAPQPVLARVIYPSGDPQRRKRLQGSVTRALLPDAAAGRGAHGVNPRRRRRRRSMPRVANSAGSSGAEVATEPFLHRPPPPPRSSSVLGASVVSRIDATRDSSDAVADDDAAAPSSAARRGGPAAETSRVRASARSHPEFARGAPIRPRQSRGRRRARASRAAASRRLRSARAAVRSGPRR